MDNSVQIKTMTYKTCVAGAWSNGEVEMSDLQQLFDTARAALGVSEEAQARAREDPRFSAEVRARLKVATQNALANIAVISERQGVENRLSLGRRLREVVNSSEPAWIRLRKIYALINEQNSFNQDNVACRKGCAHCCHIPVAVPEVEAKMIGMAIGRRPKNVAAYQEDGHYASQSYGYHTPCPFLQDNRCSIYEHRPLACRKLVSLDIDDLLCRLVSPPGPPVPYFDTVEFDFALVTICATKLGVKTADIREYFPPVP